MFKKISYTLLIATLFLSCEVDEKFSSNCPSTIGVPTTLVTGPTETTVDVPITLEVSYKAKGDCGDFTSFFKNPSTDPFVDIITVNTTFDACSCKQEVATTLKENYTFKKALPGVYTIKFKDTNQTTIDHTVTVQ